MSSPVNISVSLRARLRETVAQFCHERLHGRDSDRRQQAMDMLYTTPEGKALLDTAAQYNVPIRFMRAGKVGALGSLSKNPEDATVGVSVANTGNLPQMVLTLYHELRHLKQQEEQGDIKNGVFMGLKNTRRSHMLSLMQEADAFTSEAMFALDRNAAGDKTYLNSVMNPKHDLARVTAQYIKTAPVAYEQDKDAFRRGLFTHIMLEGLAGYSASYFLGYAAAFRKAATRDEFTALVGDLRELRKPDNTGELASAYGPSYVEKMSMTALARVFFKTLPMAEQQALELVDKSVRSIGKMTEEQYQKTREAATAALISVYQTDPRDLAYSNEADTLRRTLSAAAADSAPDLRAAFAKVAARKMQPPAGFAPRAPRPL